MATKKRDILRIRNHKILVDSNEVEIRGNKYRLSPKEMEVLVQLVSHPGRTLSRPELLEQVWGDPFGNDMGLTQAISKLRYILGDTDRTLIRTIPKKGYQLVSEPEPKAQKKSLKPLLLVLIIVGLLISGLVIYKPIGIRVQVMEIEKRGSTRSQLDGLENAPHALLP